MKPHKLTWMHDRCRELIDSPFNQFLHQAVKWYVCKANTCLKKRIIKKQASASFWHANVFTTNKKNKKKAHTFCTGLVIWSSLTLTSCEGISEAINMEVYGVTVLIITYIRGYLHHL